MTRTLAVGALAVAALATPAAARPTVPPVADPAVECFIQYVTRAEPVPQTLEERVQRAVDDVERTVRFVTCVASG